MYINTLTYLYMSPKSINFSILKGQAGKHN